MILRIFIVSFALGFVVHVGADRMVVGQLSDSASNQALVQLCFNTTLSNSTQIAYGEKALKTLLGDLESQIKDQAGFTGQFAGNCTLLVRETLQRAICDLVPVRKPTLSSGYNLSTELFLPYELFDQITRKAIVLANVYGDWRRKTSFRSERYLFSVYDPSTTCSQTNDWSFTHPPTPSSTHKETDTQTVTVSLSPETTETIDTKTLTLPRSLSPLPTPTASNPKSQSESLSLPVSESAWASESNSVSSSRSVSDPGSESVSKPVTDSWTHTMTVAKNIWSRWSDSLSESVTGTLFSKSSQSISPPSSTHSPSSSISDSLELTESLLPLPNWLHWQSGVFMDSTQQIGRYVEFEPGIVTDSYTGLEWEKANATNLTWVMADQRCRGLRTGGHRTWRLPRFLELVLLVDDTQNTGAALNQVAFPNASNGFFWSSTPRAGYPATYWYVDFGVSRRGVLCAGGTYSCSNLTTANTRCVRGYPVTEMDNRFIDATHTPLTPSSNQVLDRLTDLIWQRGVSSQLNQTDAVSYCSQLQIGSETKGSWQVPKIKELATLLNETVVTGPSTPGPNTINREVFPNAGFDLWASTNGKVRSTAFLADLGWGSLLPWTQSDPSGNYVRCVRSGTLTPELSGTHSQSLSESQCLPTVPPTNGYRAVWPARTGVYSDSTNQSGRFYAANGIVYDKATQIQWQQNPSPYNMTYANAVSYCANQTTGGHSDWRLPNLDDLNSIVDYNQWAPRFDPQWFPNASDFRSVWSSSFVAGLGSGYQWVPFWARVTSSSYYVYCVRSCYGNVTDDRYRLLNAEVTDVVTGLAWQQKAANLTLSQPASVAFCNSLSLNGHFWRLPKFSELLTLVNNTKKFGTFVMNEILFAGEPNGYYWSDSLYNNTAVEVDSKTGNAPTDTASQLRYFRCVRSCDAPQTNGLLSAWPVSQGVYRDNTNQTGRYSILDDVIIDIWTDLYWQRQPSLTNRTFDDAQYYCGNQNFGGYQDWRVPNIGELGTLVNQPSFPDNLNLGSWSESPVTGRTGFAWLLNASGTTQLGQQSTGSNWPVRCVRSCYALPSNSRYVVSSGVVLDQATKLLWKSNAAGQKLNQSDAITYCNNLNLGSEPTPWHLPSASELLTLVNSGNSFNSSMLTNSTFPGEPAGIYWSASPEKAIDFQTGLISNSPASDLNLIRCLREYTATPAVGLGSIWPASTGVYQDLTNQTGRYRLSNDTVFDSLTNLTWQRNASALTMNYVQAGAYCASQTTGGRADFRLPNINELNTLWDYTRAYQHMSNPYWNSTIFGNPLLTLWSTTYNPTNPTQAWASIPSSYGRVQLRDFSSLFNVRCVSGDSTAQISPRYQSAFGEVLDSVTGLVWQQGYSSQVYNWTQAIQYCPQLTLNGHAWLMPTVRELQTLINYTKFPASSTALMDDQTFRAATVYSSSNIGGYPWRLVYGTNSEIYALLPGNSHSVRCVRSTCQVPPSNGLLAAWPANRGVYDDATNQTGRYAIGNGTVLDTLTGITWQQNASATTMNFTDAQVYCASQTTGGQTGWRVPNIVELNTLYNYVGNLRIDNSLFLGPTMESYWSGSSQIGSVGGKYWDLQLSIGFNWADTNVTLDRVRCVRSCYQVPTGSRYQAVNGEVTDLFTGLVWQQHIGTQSANQTDAVKLCRNLTLNGNSWRLPTVRELQTLVDYNRSQGTLMMDTNWFLGEPANRFWSSTPSWRVTFHEGLVDPLLQANRLYFRCVRSN